QEEKYRTGQRSEDTRNGKGKVLAEADQRTRRQHKEIRNMEKFGKQDRKRWEEQGRKTIIESEKINTLQRRPIGKWKKRTREETEEENTVGDSMMDEDRPVGLSKRRTEEEEDGRSKGKRRCKEQYEKKIINM
ncbi:5974_t:CDS:2, partial [Gigaspora rosea]